MNPNTNTSTIFAALADLARGPRPTQATTVARPLSAQAAERTWAADIAQTR